MFASETESKENGNQSYFQTTNVTKTLDQLFLGYGFSAKNSCLGKIVGPTGFERNIPVKRKKTNFQEKTFDYREF